MKCPECGRKMATRTATKVKPYVYRGSGLDGVLLVGIKVHECGSCGPAPEIPQIRELHKVLTHWILEKPKKLTGKELRYLRKHAGIAAVRFAEQLGIRPEHLSRVENGHREVSNQLDKLARVIVALGIENKDVRDVLSGGRRNRVLRYSSSRNVWEIKAA
jgi:DNA-binding transcriptional regulator YiaG